MPKGYWITHVDVSDWDAYRNYVDGIQAPLAAFGGRYLVRAGEVSEVEGDLRARSVVIEFPSVEAAHACYRSAEYRAARTFRDAAAADLVVVAGYNGAQPAENDAG